MGRKRKVITESPNPFAKKLLEELENGGGYKENIRLLQESGISIQQVNGWLWGRRTPRLCSLKRIARILNFDLNSWFNFEPQGVSNEISSTRREESS